MSNRQIRELACRSGGSTLSGLAVEKADARRGCVSRGSARRCANRNELTAKKIRRFIVAKSLTQRFAQRKFLDSVTE